MRLRLLLALHYTPRDHGKCNMHGSGVEAHIALLMHLPAAVDEQLGHLRELRTHSILHAGAACHSGAATVSLRHIGRGGAASAPRCQAKAGCNGDPRVGSLRAQWLGHRSHNPAERGSRTCRFAWCALQRWCLLFLVRAAHAMACSSRAQTSSGVRLKRSNAFTSAFCSSSHSATL